MFWIKNRRFPKKGFRAITLYPFVFYKGELPQETINHESIHGRQQKELLIIGFYMAYVIEWLFEEYRTICFEEEARAHQYDDNYLNNRKWFAMWRKK